MEYILLMIGFIFLIKGADLFVEGSCNLARFLKVPSVIIGLTIVAMGTSAPEASVSIRAAFTGNNEIALSNIIGSNIFNGLIVVGICAFLASFKASYIFNFSCFVFSVLLNISSPAPKALAPITSDGSKPIDSPKYGTAKNAPPHYCRYNC